jgi:hypothetical protein
MRVRNPIAAHRQRRLRRILAPQVAAVESFLEAREQPDSQDRPVVFFNASTRIHTLSLNAAFGLLASWALGQGRCPSAIWLRTRVVAVRAQDVPAPTLAASCAACQA